MSSFIDYVGWRKCYDNGSPESKNERQPSSGTKEEYMWGNFPTNSQEYCTLHRRGSPSLDSLSPSFLLDATENIGSVTSVWDGDDGVTQVIFTQWFGLGVSCPSLNS